jgi:hypothetical protein
VALPEPAPLEPHDEFVNRCMHDEEMSDEFPDFWQRQSVCFFIWDNKDSVIYETTPE